MNFIISASTDVGVKKDTNQDSLSVKTINTVQGRMAFGIICDGMGGLDKGEVASAAVIYAFEKWIKQRLPLLCELGITEDAIKQEWTAVVTDMNKRIREYGEAQGVSLGTTVVSMLITQQRYYVLNVGDSRAYELTAGGIRQITKDQTLVAREIEQGRLTPQEALLDARRNVLLQCCGASEEVYPEFFFGDTAQDAVYMMCSDGFRHEITAEEIYDRLRPEALYDFEGMKANAEFLIALNKQRAEQDNISVLLVRTF